MHAEEQAERELALEKARERVLDDFEKAQQLGPGRTKAPSASVAASNGAPASTAGVKRKFEFDKDEVERLVQEAEERALRQLEAEQVRLSLIGCLDIAYA